LNQIKFNREGDLLFSCSKDSTVNAWFSHNGERLGTYDGHNGTVWSLDVDREYSTSQEEKERGRERREEKGEREEKRPSVDVLLRSIRIGSMKVLNGLLAQYGDRRKWREGVLKGS